MTSVTLHVSDFDRLRSLGFDLGSEEAEKPTRKKGSKLQFDAVLEHNDKGDPMPEFARIIGLERRPIPDPNTHYAKELAGWMTRRLARVPQPYPLWVNGVKKGDHLFPTQALAIKDLLTYGKLAAPIRVGGGKMLLAYLIFSVLQAKRPLYILPKSMLSETKAEVLKYSADWKGPKPTAIRYLSYQLLSSASSGGKVDVKSGEVLRLPRLETLLPDVIVCDESQWLANRSAKGAKRLQAYLDRHPNTIIVTMSGNYLRESVNNAAHLFAMSLKGNGPLPNDWSERMAWASALDEKQNVGMRTELGALIRFLNKQERDMFYATVDPDERRAVVCGALGRYILETPGVVGSQDGPLGIPLSIDAQWVTREDARVNDAIRILVQGDKPNKVPKWSLPNGALLIDSLGVARVRHTMALGFWARPEPAPPKSYREAKLEWAKAARDRLKHNGLGIDSEANLKEAMRAGAFRDIMPELEAWEEERRLYTERTGLLEPPSVAQWFSDELIEQVAAWFDERGDGIVWTPYIPVGLRLAESLGIPYFGEKKIDLKTGRHVMDMKKGERCVCSIGAVGTGTNLQHFHSRGLWLGSPSEQPLGRTHRPGQAADKVENWVYLPGLAQLTRYWAQRDKAMLFAQPMTQQAQKIVYAESDIPRVDELPFERANAWRWRPHGKRLDKDD